MKSDSFVTIPIVPPEALIDSMCLRFDHSFGLMDENQKQVLRSDMRKVYEEITGVGFFQWPATHQDTPGSIRESRLILDDTPFPSQK